MHFVFIVILLYCSILYEKTILNYFKPRKKNISLQGYIIYVRISSVSNFSNNIYDFTMISPRAFIIKVCFLPVTKHNNGLIKNLKAKASTSFNYKHELSTIYRYAPFMRNVEATSPKTRTLIRTACIS